MKTPDEPRTFPGDPNPPPKAPDAPKLAAAAGPQSSAGTGALPPEAMPGQQNQPASTDHSFSVVQRPDGTRDVFMSDKNGDTKIGNVNTSDADHVLNAAAPYNENLKTWDNVPENVAKSLISGRMGFPERIANAWHGGEAGVVEGLTWAKMLRGEMTAEQARETSAPELLKARLDQDPSLAWHGLGETTAAYLKHPVKAAEQAAVGAVAMAPMLRDILFHGTLPGAAAGTAGGLAASGVALAAGPLAPEVATAVVTKAMEVGAAYGTGHRAYELFGGQFAAEMDRRGYDDGTIRTYAPVVGMVNAALTATQFELMTPTMQAKVLSGIAGSSAAKEAIAAAVFKFGSRTAGFTTLADAQQLVNDYVGNMAALTRGVPVGPIPGLLAAGNIDLAKRPVVKNPDGSVSTVRSISVEVDGNEVLLPTISQDGKNLTEREAIAQYEKTGKNLGIFEDVKSANDYAKRLHEAQQNMTELLVSGKEMLAHLGDATLKNMGVGAVMAGATGLTEEAGRLSQARPAEPSPALGPDTQTSESAGEPQPIDRASEELKKQSQTGGPSSDKSIPPGDSEVKALTGIAAEKARPVLEEYAAKEGREATDPKFAQELHDRVRDDTDKVIKPMLGLKAQEGVGALTPEELAAAKAKYDAMPEEQKAKLAERLMENTRVQSALSDHVGNLRADETPEREFFKPSSINSDTIKGAENPGVEARKQIVGDKNEQVVRMNQEMDKAEREVPDPKDRGAIWRWLDAGGDPEKLRAAAQNEDLPVASREEYARAIQLDGKPLEWAQRLQKFYSEAMDVGRERGTLDDARQNYTNRLYAPDEKRGTKTDLGAMFKRSTSHAAERIFNTAEEAETVGKKKFLTTDAFKLARIYNEELAGSNANRAGLDAMEKAGVFSWNRKPPGNDWVEVKGIRPKEVPIKGADGKAVLDENGDQIISTSKGYAPAGIADAMKPLMDPDKVKQIPVLKAIHDFQAAVKSGLLSYSLFHDVTMVSQAVNQRAIGALLRSGSLDELMAETSFRNNEQYHARLGLMTAGVGQNIDIVGDLMRKNGGFFDDVKDAPVIKQLLAGNDAHTQQLFGKEVRYLKVMDAARQTANWTGAHPEATLTETTAAHRAICEQVNDAYGGQNWEALGMTKSNLSLMRLALLAPDWLVSNGRMAAAALGDFGVKGNATRAHFAIGIAGGIIATEGLNKMFTGHYTNENPPGHKLEVEIQPGVWVSMFRGATGEAIKVGSMLKDTPGGPAVGALRYGSSKLAPLARVGVTGVGVAADRNFPDYTGRPIIRHGATPGQGTYDLLKYLLSQETPVPFSVSNLWSYKDDSHATVAGAAALATGVPRYSKGRKK